MKRYKSFHTILKKLANKDLLPDIFLNRIDWATLWRWKQEPDDKYTGKELINIAVLEIFISRTEAQKIMRTYLKVAFVFAAIFVKAEGISHILKHDLATFVQCLQRYRKNIDLKLILRLCRIPLSVYYGWRNRILKLCETSSVGLCKKTWPHQLASADCGVIDLILDGGPENNNEVMKAFVNREEVRIKPLFALKDIPYSNSIIEAQNKLFKYRYLFQQEYEDIHGLRKIFTENVLDYNYIRPHISLAVIDYLSGKIPEKGKVFMNQVINDIPNISVIFSPFFSKVLNFFSCAELHKPEPWFQIQSYNIKCRETFL